MAPISASAATNFVGAAGSDIRTGSNWSSGLPTLTNPGLLAGADAGEYDKAADLDDTALDISGTASLTGTKKTSATSAEITVRDNGRWTAEGDVMLGQKAGAGRTVVTIQDDGQFEVVDSNLALGRRQASDIIQQGGTVTVGRDLTVGDNAAGAGSTYQLSGGSLAVGGDTAIEKNTAMTVSGGSGAFGGKLEIADAGSAYRQSAGSVTVADEFRVGQDTEATVSGGQLALSDDLTLDQNANFAASGGTVTVAGDADIDGNGATFSQAGGLVRIDGNLNLDAGNGRTYELVGGELQVAGAIAVSSSNNFLWTNGGTLGVHPSSSTLVFDGDLTAGSGSRLRLDTAGEKLLVMNDLTIDGLIVEGFDAMLPAHNGAVQTGEFVLIEAALINGTEADIQFTNFLGLQGLTRIGAGDTFDADNDSVYWFGVSGQQVTLGWSLGKFAPIPEPSAGLLLSSASSSSACAAADSLALSKGRRCFPQMYDGRAWGCRSGLAKSFRWEMRESARPPANAIGGAMSSEPASGEIVLERDVRLGLG